MNKNVLGEKMSQRCIAWRIKLKRVQIKDDFNARKTVTARVPKGSIDGPVSFN